MTFGALARGSLRARSGLAQGSLRARSGLAQGSLRGFFLPRALTMGKGAVIFRFSPTNLLAAAFILLAFQLEAPAAPFNQEKRVWGRLRNWTLRKPNKNGGKLALGPAHRGQGAAPNRCRPTELLKIKGAPCHVWQGAKARARYALDFHARQVPGGAGV